MASIRLEDVSRAFSKPAGPKGADVVLRSIVPGGAGPIPTLGSDADRGFDERVELQNLRSAAGQDGHSEKVVALDHVNLAIPDGQTMSVVGPSGCGKSTLLRVVAGLDPFTGRVFYDDQDMASVPPKDRGIGMVFQNYALYPQLESRGNLSFFFKMHRAPDEETEERIRVTSQLMGTTSTRHSR